MAASTITLQRTYGTTITQALTAFGPNKTQAYDSLVLSTVQSPVTAWIVSYAFSNAVGYHGEEGNIFTFATNPFGTLPAAITNTGITVNLSAHVGECALGENIGSLAITLSSTALSGVSAVGVATPTQILTFPLTAVNQPYHHHLCEKRFKRLRETGVI